MAGRCNESWNFENCAHLLENCIAYIDYLYYMRDIIYLYSNTSIFTEAIEGKKKNKRSESLENQYVSI